MTLESHVANIITNTFLYNVTRAFSCVNKKPWFPYFH